MRAPEQLWYGIGAGARVARAALAPLELLYGAAVAVRNALYERGVLQAVTPRIPTLSVGNIAVGGTGKTPISAWLVNRLVELGARPAVVLRGYGADEPLVHERLNPDVPTIVGADRAVGVARAAEAGSDVAVLDDAFQHRRVRRVADVVLVSADRGGAVRRLLPAGPLREPWASLRRATLLVVTRRAAARDTARGVADELRALVPRVPVAVIHLALGSLHRADGDEVRPVAELRGRPVRAVASIADPAAFVRQVEALGARVSAHVFDDHHAFTLEEVTRLAFGAGDATVVCTLKDAVKLRHLWPRGAPPLWYVSQQVVVESGGDAIDAMLREVLRARHLHPNLAGTVPARP